MRRAWLSTPSSWQRLYAESRHPVYALNGEKGDVEPAYMASTVKDRYKAFSGDTFYVAEYDTTYRRFATTRATTI